jgi:hypothetical protein
MQVGVGRIAIGGNTNLRHTLIRTRAQNNCWVYFR